MLIKKIAVPLINDKILQQAEHCYIVTSSITDAGFDFIRSRIPPKCKIDMVTGLDEPTSPAVLHRMLNNYQGRINLHIYTRNVLHGNVYIFDLPFRKSVAFVGSGGLSLNGLKDQEEIFWKVSDPKEIESLLSWFTGYFEFGEPLTENLIRQYEAVYPEIKRNDVEARKFKRDAIAQAALNLDLIKFKNQFFKKEDFEMLSGLNCTVQSKEIQDVRQGIISKLQKLVEDTSVELNRVGLYLLNPATGGYSEVALYGRQVNCVFASFGKNPSGFNPGPAVMQFGITATHIALRLCVNGDNESHQMRLKFRDRMQEPEFRQKFFNEMTALGGGYYIEVGANRKPVDFFKQEQILLEFLHNDLEMFFPVLIEKTFAPGDAQVSSGLAAKTTVNEFIRLRAIYELLQEIFHE
jgi:hypothetical protein